MTGGVFGHCLTLCTLFTDRRWDSHRTFFYSWTKFDGRFFKKSTSILVLKDTAPTPFHNFLCPKAQETILQGI